MPWGKIMYGSIGSASVFKDRKGYFTAGWDEILQKEYKKYLPKSWKPAPDVQKECFNEEKRKWQNCKPPKLSNEHFQRHTKILFNGKNRILYRKSSSKKANPVLYIKHKGVMVTYKQFLKQNGGGNIVSRGQSSTSQNYQILDYELPQNYKILDYELLYKPYSELKIFLDNNTNINMLVIEFIPIEFGVSESTYIYDIQPLKNLINDEAQSHPSYTLESEDITPLYDNLTSDIAEVLAAVKE